MNKPKSVSFVISLFILFQLTSQSGFSQALFKEGIIITNEGDTLQGFIYSKGETSIAKVCRFKKNLNENEVVYEPFDIEAFRFTKSGRFYISKLVEKEKRYFPMFVEYVLDGVVDLYYYRDNWSEHYLIDKNLDNQTLIELSNEERELIEDGKTFSHKSNKYIGILKAGFADTPAIFPEIEEAEFHRNTFIDISKQYHDLVCNEGDICIVYEKDINTLEIAVGLTGGVGSNTIIFPHSEEFSEVDFGYEMFSQYGFGINFSSGALNERMIIQLSFLKEIKSFSGDITHYGFLLSEAYNYDLTMNHSSVNGAIGYSAPKGNIRPFILPGFSVNFGEAIIDEYLARTFDSVQTDTHKITSHKTKGVALSLRTGFNYFITDRAIFNTSLQGIYSTGSYENLRDNRYFQYGIAITGGLYYKL